MNNYQFIFTLFSFSFFACTQAAQISKTTTDQKASHEPLTFESADYQHVFIIHPHQINIYKNQDIYQAATQEEFLASVDDYNARRKLWLNYDAIPDNNKITGEEYKSVLTTSDPEWLKRILLNGFVIPFKEIIQNNSIDINAKMRVMHFIDIAIYNNKPEMVKLFIELGIDVNKPQSSNTPLQLATSLIKDKIVKLLLLAGANIRQTAQNSHLASPARFAMTHSTIYKLVSEIYFAREAEQRELPHKIFLAKGVGNVKKIANEIIEYLLGKNHKVMSMSACKKALDNL